MADVASVVELILIHRNPPCKKCLKVKALLLEAGQEAKADTSFREIFMDAPEAEPYGPVVSPTVLINGKMASGGFTPLKSSLVKLIEKQAGR